MNCCFLCRKSVASNGEFFASYRELVASDKKFHTFDRKLLASDRKKVAFCKDIVVKYSFLRV